MGDGERKFVLVLLGVGMIGLTVLYTFLFVSLWAYKEWVGLSLFLLLVVVGLVSVLGRLNEQRLRRERYHYHEEIPLDVQGEPYYWPTDAQENPYHAGVPVGRTHSHLWSEGYQRER
jgi:hypothetical protein